VVGVVTKKSQFPVANFRPKVYKYNLERIKLFVEVGSLDNLIKSAGKIFDVERFSHSANFTYSKSDLRIQLRTDPRYQPFIRNASVKDVLGYKMKVAAVEDILQEAGRAGGLEVKYSWMPCQTL